MRPLRVKRNCEVTHDPVTGQERILESTYEVDVLSDQGSVDSLGKRERHFGDCGCNKPAGGRCVSCGSISCVDCHGHCHVCNAPTCLRCSVLVDMPGGQRLRFCRPCHAQIVRRQRLRAVGRFFLAPFVRFEE